MLPLILLGMLLANSVAFFLIVALILKPPVEDGAVAVEDVGVIVVGGADEATSIGFVLKLDGALLAIEDI
jgi:hypothetical protein